MSRAEGASAGETRRRVVEVAEQMFSDHGFDGVSMRALTQTAGVNLAAVNYHFGSKAGLFQAVLDRHLEPITAKRLALLDAAEAGLPEDPPGVEALLDIFVGVPVRHFAANRAAAQAVMRLVGQIHAAPNDVAKGHVEAHFAPTVQRFQTAFGRVLPDLSPDQVLFRMMAVVGMFKFLLCGPTMGPNCAQLTDLDPDELTRRIVAFASPGFSSPPL